MLLTKINCSHNFNYFFTKSKRLIYDFEASKNSASEAKEFTPADIESLKNKLHLKGIDTTLNDDAKKMEKMMNPKLLGAFLSNLAKALDNKNAAYRAIKENAKYKNFSQLISRAETDPPYFKSLQEAYKYYHLYYFTERQNVTPVEGLKRIDTENLKPKIYRGSFEPGYQENTFTLGKPPSFETLNRHATELVSAMIVRFDFILKRAPGYPDTTAIKNILDVPLISKKTLKEIAEGGNLSDERSLLEAYEKRDYLLANLINKKIPDPTKLINNTDPDKTIKLGDENNTLFDRSLVEKFVKMDVRQAAKILKNLMSTRAINAELKERGSRLQSIEDQLKF